MLLPLAIAACVPDEPAPVAPGSAAFAAQAVTPEATEDAWLEEGGVATCADPGARASLGPMAPAAMGEAWDEQAFVAPNPARRMGWGLAVQDFDDDGDLEILLANAFDTELWVRAEDGTWADETVERLGDVSGWEAFGASAADADGDGDVDIYLPLLHAPDKLLLNDGAGYFTHGSEAAGLLDEAWAGYSAAWGDQDGDGDLDLFVSNYYDELTDEGPPADAHPNVLYRNDGAGHFTDVSADLLSDDDRNGYTFVAGWYDFDGDRAQDLYIVNDHGPLKIGNRYLHNTGAAGGWTFEDRSATSGLGWALEGMGLSVGDLNDDAVPDVLVSSWSEMVLAESADGAWFDTSQSRGLACDSAAGRVTGWAPELADFDDDGDLDAFVAFGRGRDDAEFENPDEQPDGLWLQEDGVFRQVADDWGVAGTGKDRGAAVADLDGDGWLDLVVRDVEALPSVYTARCGDDGWLRVELRQPGPNTRGVGAIVEVEADGRTWRRWIQDGSSSLATAEPVEAHFGLGDVDVVDALVVTWPDGEISRFEDVATRQRVRVVRDP